MVSVYGSSTVTVEHDDYVSAERLGRLLGEAGAGVACGGYGGVMEGVARGAAAAGGRTVGYTVQGWGMREANRYLSEERPCSDLYERLRRLIEDSDALVALGGGIGTLAEVALAWNHLYMELIDPRPLIIVGRPWATAVDALGDLLEISRDHMRHVTRCATVDEVVGCLEREGVIE